MHLEKYDLTIPTDISDKRILDYGCGNGNLIDSNNISPDLYTGLEIDKSAYRYCVDTYPDYTFVYQDLHSEVYNKNGTETIPTLNDRYDIIFAYSVFTHTTYEYFLQCVDVFKSCLNKGGSIYISMILFENDRMIRYFVNKRKKRFGSCDTIEKSSTVGYLVDNKYSSNVTRCDSLVSIYNEDFLTQHGELIKTSMNQDILKIV